MTGCSRHVASTSSLLSQLSLAADLEPSISHIRNGEESFAAACLCYLPPPQGSSLQHTVYQQQEAHEQATAWRGVATSISSRGGF